MGSQNEEAPENQEYQPFMPHLTFTAEELDRYHPSVTAPDDVDDSREVDLDARDEVYQHGLEIVSEIKERMKAEGRRRCEEAS